MHIDMIPRQTVKHPSDWLVDGCGEEAGFKKMKEKSRRHTMQSLSWKIT